MSNLFEGQPTDAYELFISGKVHASFSEDRFSRNADIDKYDAFFAYFGVCFANYARDMYHARYMTVSCPRNGVSDTSRVKLAKSEILAAAYTHNQVIDIEKCHSIRSNHDSTINTDDLIAFRDYTLKNCPVLFQRMFCLTNIPPGTTRKRVANVINEFRKISEAFAGTINDEAFAEVVSEILKDVKNWRPERRGKYRKRREHSDSNSKVA